MNKADGAQLLVSGMVLWICWQILCVLKEVAAHIHFQVYGADAEDK